MFTIFFQIAQKRCKNDVSFQFVFGPLLIIYECKCSYDILLKTAELVNWPANGRVVFSATGMVQKRDMVILLYSLHIRRHVHVQLHSSM